MLRFGEKVNHQRGANDHGVGGDVAQGQGDIVHGTSMEGQACCEHLQDDDQLNVQHKRAKVKWKERKRRDAIIPVELVQLRLLTFSKNFPYLLTTYISGKWG